MNVIILIHKAPRGKRNSCVAPCGPHQLEQTLAGRRFRCPSEDTDRVGGEDDALASNVLV
jgi:hypothetical protein